VSKEEKAAVRKFIYFLIETGQFSRDDDDFIKAMYYEFKLEQE